MYIENKSIVHSKLFDIVRGGSVNILQFHNFRFYSELNQNKGVSTLLFFGSQKYLSLVCCGSQWCSASWTVGPNQT